MINTVGKLAFFLVCFYSCQSQESTFYSMKRALRNADKAEKLVLVEKSSKEFSPKVANLLNLKELVIERCYYQHYPAELIDLDKLERIRFTGTRFDTLPEFIVKLSALNRLSIHGGLNHFDRDWCSLSNTLQVLSLTWNEINALPDIGCLKSLRLLYLHQNQLTRLPDGVEELSNLENIGFGGNPIEDLDKELRRLKGLEKLRAVDIPIMGLTEFPMGLLELEHLEQIDLSFNPIMSFPDELAKLKNLKTFKIRRNSEPIDQATFLRLKKLLPPGCKIYR